MRNKSRNQLQQDYLNAYAGAAVEGGLTLTASRSAQGVFFVSEEGKNIRAVKPYAYLGGEQDAHHERAMYELLSGMGFLTLKSLSVERPAGQSTTYHVTEHIPGLVTLAEIMRTDPSEPSVASMVDESVRATAHTMGLLHARGISLGDAQTKNFAIIGQDTSQAAVFDLPGGGTPETGHRRTAPFTDDILTFVRSAIHNRYDNTDKLRQHVLAPYVEGAAGNPVTDLSRGIEHASTLIDTPDVARTAA